MKVIAVIPALNEEFHIARVVDGTQNYTSEVIVTVDEKSEDNTWSIADWAGATVRKGASGLGANLKRGINIALSRRPDVIVLLDGDGQHNPEEIPNLLKPILDDQADVVMGNRTIQRGMPPYRIFGNGILTAFANFHSQKQFADSMIGFWAIRREALPELTESGWGIYTELLLKCRSNGHRLISVPITPIYHSSYKDNSTLPPLKLGIRLLWAIIKWRLICEVLHAGKAK